MSAYLNDVETKRMHEKYQGTTIGHALIDSLEQMHKSGDLSAPEAQNVLEIFDRALEEELAAFDAKTNRIQLKIDGQLDMYRFDGHVWTLDCEAVKMQYTSPPSKEVTDIGRVVVTAAEQPSQVARKITKKGQ